MEMEQPRGVSCCATASYWGAVKGREWHLTAWRWGASDQLAADALVHIESAQMVFKVRRGKLRGMVPRAEGVISSSHHLAAVKGDKQENQYSHSGQFTTRASLSRAVCQNQSLKWSGMWTADKVGVRAHWSHCRAWLKSCSGPWTAPERQWQTSANWSKAYQAFVILKSFLYVQRSPKLFITLEKFNFNFLLFNQQFINFFDQKWRRNSQKIIRWSTWGFISGEKKHLSAFLYI